MRSLSSAFWACASASILFHAAPADAAPIEKVLYSFCSQPSCADGGNPLSSVLSVKDELYVTTSAGGPDNTSQGSVIAIKRRTGAATVYTFESYPGNLRDAEAALIHLNGKLYGTVGSGGLNPAQAGAVYSLNPKSGALKILYSFCGQSNCADGAFPTASLLEMDGLLYGTTSVGGTGICDGPNPGCGTVFSLDPKTGVEQVLYAFCPSSGCADGSWPRSGVIAVNGILYGTAYQGGTGSTCFDGDACGVVFALDPATGTETTLHTFAGGTADGGSPWAGLVAMNGLLYGTTQYGGGLSPCGFGEGCGTVFSIDPVSGAETVLHVFKDDGKDGQNPLGGLLAMNGKLYGTTEFGGAHGQGTVFSLDPATGKEKVVYAFAGSGDGGNPFAGLIAVRGTLYGTAGSGGVSNGVVFSLKP